MYHPFQHAAGPRFDQPCRWRVTLPVDLDGQVDQVLQDLSRLRDVLPVAEDVAPLLAT